MDSRKPKIIPKILAIFILATGSVYWILRHYSIAYNPLWLISDYKNLRPYVIAQSKVETGDYTSDLYKRANNAFGMRVPELRRSNRIGTTNNYSSYASIGDSLEDLLYYFEAVNFPTNIGSVGEYTMELKKRNYFTADYYTYLKNMQLWM